MESIVQGFVNLLGVWLPRIVAALAILLVGWIVALIVRAIARRLLKWLKLDARLAKGMEGTDEKPMSVENIIAQLVYYVVIFIGVLGSARTRWA